MLLQLFSNYMIQVKDIVKYTENGSPVRRLRRKVKIVHSDNIAGRSFWDEHCYHVKELGEFGCDIGKFNTEYLRCFHFENKLMPSTWIVVRIDGCHFHRLVTT